MWIAAKVQVSICFYQPQLSKLSNISAFIDHFSYHTLRSVPPSHPHLWIPHCAKVYPWNTGMGNTCHHRLDHNPYLIPHKLSVAPLILSQGTRCFSCVFSDKRFELTLTSNHFTNFSGPFLLQDLTEIDTLFLQEKLRFLLSPYTRKIFTCLHSKELQTLPFIKRSLPDQDLWLILPSSLKNTFQKVPHIRPGDFLLHSYPKERTISLGRLIQALQDPKKLTPLYH